MKIRELRSRAYRIPFRGEFTTSREVLAWREGILLEMESDEAVGLGEIAPLTPEALAISRAVLARIGPRLIGLEPAAAARTVTGEGVAFDAVRCGLDIAACDLMARAAGLSVASYLGGQPRPVAVNATIAMSDTASALAAAAQAVAAGFKAIKLKVGMMEDARAERARIAAVREAIGSRVRLRLDANRAWSVPRAISTLAMLADLDIEYVEEPIASTNEKDLAAVRRAGPIAIAADESLCIPGAPGRLLANRAADLWVLKPMLLGGLRPALLLAREAEQSGVEAVVTTTIDSGVAIAAALHLAAAIPARRACGLATAPLLASTLVRPAQTASAGIMVCPDRPGLSVEIDEGEAAPYLEAV